MVLKPGENPRIVLPAHSERGPLVHSFTLQEVAQAAGATYQTARKAASLGRLDLSDLRSIVEYIQQSRARKVEHFESAPPTLPAQQQQWWANRWPHFLLFACAADGCDQLQFAAGFCAKHGGDRKPPMRFADDWSIEVLLGGANYVPLARLIVQPEEGRHVHHRDGNAWNNRLSNLEELTPAEHEDRHVGALLSAPVKPNPPPGRLMRTPPGTVVMTRAELQAVKDEAYARGLQAGKVRSGR